ncbi:MAG TPA: S8 family serine peptidase, partial [Micromonosporaceae bacterium]|nr:S8 family serine peptidase [Micromonosporaceae bacterium]
TAIGIAPGATWIAAKIFNDHGVATSTGIHLAIQWLLDPDRNPATPDAPDVVNNSWTMSGAGCNLDFATDLANLRAAGILPVFAAGNFGPTAGSVPSPANNPDAFAVGSTDDADVVDPSSGRGPSACDGQVTPRLVAPGVGIRTTDLFGLYTDVSGTSLAAPHVAGALALLLSAFPDTSAERQATALRMSAVDLGQVGPDSDYGYGRLDAFAAYQWLATSPDFSVTAAPATVTVASGTTGHATVTVAAQGGFAGTVAFSLSGLPVGVGTATFTPTAVTGSGSSQLSIATTASAPAGTYPLTVTGTGGGTAHSTTVTLVVVPKDFTVSATPLSVTVKRGKNGVYTVKVVPSGGFTGAVKLKVTGLPANATKTFVPNPVANGSGTATLTVKTTATTTKGTFHLKITATSGTLVHTVTVTLVVA